MDFSAMTPSASPHFARNSRSSASSAKKLDSHSSSAMPCNLLVSVSGGVLSTGAGIVQSLLVKGLAHRFRLSFCFVQPHLLERAPAAPLACWVVSVGGACGSTTP